MNSKCKQSMLNIMLGKGKIPYNVNAFLSSSNGKEYETVSEILLTKKYLAETQRSLFPKKYDAISTEAITGFADNLYKTVYWYSLIISKNSTFINDFIEHKGIFEFNFLNGNFEEAEKELNYIEDNICVSLWSLKNRVMLINYQGNDSQKYIEQLGLSGNSKAFAYLFSNLTDINCRVDLYNKNLQKNLERLDDDFKPFVLYYLSSVINFTEKDYYNILKSSSTYSIIDIFILIKNVLHTQLENNNINKLLKQSITLLNSSIVDSELNFIANYNQEGVCVSPFTSELIESFSEGNYEEVQGIFVNKVKQIEDYSFPKLNLVAMACKLSVASEELTQNDNLIKTIISLMGKVIYNENLADFRQSIIKLRTIAGILKWFNISIPMHIFCNFYNGTHYFDENIIKKSFSKDDYEIYNKMVSCELIPIFPEAIKQLENCNNSEDIKTLFVSNDNMIFKSTCNYLLFNVAIHNHNYDEAIELLCHDLASAESLVYKYNIDDISQYVRDNVEIRDKVNVYDTILVCILNSLRDLKEVAIRNMLDEYNITEPLELVNSSIDKKIIYYFLREICDIDTLTSLYLLFENTNEVENYRIKICKYLLQNDDKNKQVYSQEISDILKEQEVRNLKQAVESSKLSVDYTIVEKNVYDNINILVNKYFSTPIDKKEIVSYDNVIASITDSKSWNVMAYSRDVVLSEIFYEYAKEFCFGAKGLDTYLSTRIRHGTFQNTITKVLVENNLYTGDNNFFNSLISKGHVSEKIVKVVDDFRENANRYIENLTNFTFKVFIENHIPDAIFDYNMYYEDVNYIFLYQQTHEISSTNDFINMISKCINQKTNNYLQCIRDYVLEHLKRVLINELEELKTKTQSYCLSDIGSANISDKISKCKTSLQNEIDNIKNWFFLSGSIPMNNYDWDKLIKVLNKTLAQQFNDFTSVNMNCIINSDAEMLGKTFVHFYDVLQILFTNAIVHSKFTDLSMLNIECNIKEENDFITICVKNNISEHANIEHVTTSVKRINDIFEKKEYVNLNTHQEGGMGLIKTLDLLFEVLSVGVNFNVSFDGDNYCVTIQIKKAGVVNFD